MQPINNRQSKTQKAFTLIELLVVIAIVGILAGMVVVNMSGATDRARIAKSKAFSSSLRSALLMNRVSEWKLDETSGTAVADTVGTNVGTLVSSPAWRSGTDCVSGGCLEFDGIDDMVTMPVDINGNWSIEAWAKFDTIPGSSKYPMLWGKQTDYTGYSLAFNGSGGIYSFAGSGTNWIEGPVHYPSAGVWYHYAGTYDGSYLRLYVNGAECGTKKACTTNPPLNNASAVIGRHYSSGGYGFIDGKIDEVRVYNSALAASVVRYEYLAGVENLYAFGRINGEEYQQRLSELNSTYVASKFLL
ncbi:MAG: LamG-like jellyroll fold domain-containing protein [Candidatus Paceibacterota bacterium]|jgi:prepilin-type N-terminal cleavage/methylation domain-containing protein